jgi:hypothetical protein
VRACLKKTNKQKKKITQQSKKNSFGTKMN